MEGVPADLPCEKDRARFQHLAELHGVERYQAHLTRAFAKNRYGITPGRYQKQVRQS